jgi:hypothetical protein
MKAFKLFRLRKDQTLGPIFINKDQVLEAGVTYRAENHPTPGYAVRPGWHALAKAEAPHLSLKGRVWCRVSIADFERFVRPEAQGGIWFLSQWLTIEEVMWGYEHEHKFKR